MDYSKKIIETERLVLREFDLKDDEFIVELLNSPTWLKYIGNKNVNNSDDARKYIEDKFIGSYRENGFGFWMVELKFISVPIGLCGLIKRDTLNDVDIGFAFLPDFAGNGYGFESAYATLEYAFKELGLKRIVAITLESNTASIGLLNKLGLKFEKMTNQGGDNNEELMLFSVNL